LRLGGAAICERNETREVFVQQKRKCIRDWGLVAGLCLLALASATPTQTKSEVQSSGDAKKEQREFGGTFDQLNNQQQNLVEDWIRRYNARTGKTL
jgi:hypothetical protein